MPGAIVVGSGFGCRVHVPALRAAGFDVRALVGRDEERTRRRAERAGIPHACTTIAGALAAANVDAITIATPPDTHALLTIEACESGRAVLCEKPFALNATEAEAMLDAAERAGVTNLVGHEFRWAPERALVTRAIAEGLIGEPRMFSLVSYVPLVSDPEARMPVWWFDAARGGGWLGASGSHVIDQIRTWLGQIASLTADLPTVSARTGVAEDSLVVRVVMCGGARGVIQQTAASWTPTPTGLAIVAGTDGTIEIVGDNVYLSDRDGRRPLPVSADLVLPPPPTASADARERYTHLELGPYTRLCEALLAGIEKRSQPTAVALPTFADGVAEMRVMDAIRKSAAAGGAVVELTG